MKASKWIVPVALAAGALWLLSGTDAQGAPVGQSGTGGNLLVNPNAPPGQDAISKAAREAKTAVTEKPQNYAVSGLTSSGGIMDFGKFSSAEMIKLSGGGAVVQGQTTTKIEDITTTLVKGASPSSRKVSFAGQDYPLTTQPTSSKQLIQVSPVKTDKSGMTATDRMIAANFAKQGKVSPYV